MSKNVPVRFLKAYQIYNAGEVAGFERTLADKLIAAKIATDRLEETAGAPAPQSGDPLMALSKKKLVELAKTELDLDLDPDALKADLIAAIVEARAAKNAPPV